MRGGFSLVRCRTAQRLVALTCAAMATLGVLTATASADAGCAQAVALSSLSSSDQPACWQPFTAGSPFNTELPSNPKLAADNAAVQQHMASYGWSVQNSTTGFSFSASDGTRPVYFATPSDPVLTVDCTDEEGPNTCQGANRIDVNGAQINVPAGAAPGDNWDAHMIIVETATGQEYDFWHTSISAGTLTAGTGAVENVNTSAGTADAGDAASFALTAGLLRPSELASGHIDHALVMTIPCTSANGANVGYSWPATGGWGEFCGEYWNESAATAPTIGQLFKLNMTDAQIAASGAPTWEQTIMTALAHYGAYAEDTEGSWHNEGMYILAQDPISFTSIGQPNAWTSAINALGGQNNTLSSAVPIPTDKLEVVDPCVAEGTCPGDSSNDPPADGGSSGGTGTGSSGGGSTTTTTPPASNPVTSPPVTTPPASNPVTSPPVTTPPVSSPPATPAPATSTTPPAKTSPAKTSPAKKQAKPAPRKAPRARTAARRAALARTAVAKRSRQRHRVAKAARRQPKTTRRRPKTVHRHS